MSEVNPVVSGQSPPHCARRPLSVRSSSQAHVIIQKSQSVDADNRSAAAIRCATCSRGPINGVGDYGHGHEAGNSPPTISVPDFPDVITDVAYEFSVTSSDDDLDSLTLTWDWGDGSETVTSTDTASHVYDSHGPYTLTVYADDGTNLDGHNVSDSGQVTVTSPDNTAPLIVSLTPSKTNPYTGEEITFTGVASDAEGDRLRFTFAFGDDSYAVLESQATSPDTETEFTVSHTYETAGVVSAFLYVWDYQDNSSSDPVSVTVVPNAAPLVGELVDMEALVGQEVEFTVDAFDPDGDDLSMWWDFGDGSEMVNGATVVHSYNVAGEYVYRVYVDDGHYHNVTSAAIITVFDEGTNLKPEIVALENMTGLVNAELTFNVTATDPNGDDLNYTWDFGDGSNLVVGNAVQHAYSELGEYTFTVYVDDGRGENVSGSALANITPSEPPVADAGVNRTVAIGTEVTLNGANSYDDVGIVNYTWEFTYDGEQTTLYDVSASFRFDIAGVYAVKLTVMDAEGNTASDQITVTVQDSDDGGLIDQYGLVLGALAVT